MKRNGSEYRVKQGIGRHVARRRNALKIILLGALRTKRMVCIV